MDNVNPIKSRAQARNSGTGAVICSAVTRAYAVADRDKWLEMFMAAHYVDHSIEFTLSDDGLRGVAVSSDAINMVTIDCPAADLDRCTAKGAECRFSIGIENAIDFLKGISPGKVEVVVEKDVIRTCGNGKSMETKNDIRPPVRVPRIKSVFDTSFSAGGASLLKMINDISLASDNLGFHNVDGRLVVAGNKDVVGAVIMTDIPISGSDFTVYGTEYVKRAIESAGKAEVMVGWGDHTILTVTWGHITHVIAARTDDGAAQYLAIRRLTEDQKFTATAERKKWIDMLSIGSRVEDRLSVILDGDGFHYSTMDATHVRMVKVDVPSIEFERHDIPDPVEITLDTKVALRMIRRLKGRTVTVGESHTCGLFASDGTVSYTLPGYKTDRPRNCRPIISKYTAGAEVDQKKIMGILKEIEPSSTHCAGYSKFVKFTVNGGLDIEASNPSKTFHVDCPTTGSGSGEYSMPQLKDGFRCARGSTTLRLGQNVPLEMKWDNTLYWLAPKVDQ